jgi:hypothetical protein
VVIGIDIVMALSLPAFSIEVRPGLMLPSTVAAKNARASKVRRQAILLLYDQLSVIQSLRGDPECRRRNPEAQAGRRHHLVTPTKVGVQLGAEEMKLDSGLRRNDDT